MFCVYPETDELRLRARIEEFALATGASSHDWSEFDLTDTFARWLSAQRYANKYFKSPHLLRPLLPRYGDFIGDEFRRHLEAEAANANTVVAIKGVGSLFGLLKVKQVVEALAPTVPGRLLVFFPGSYEGNNYRLLDGYDGWNYLATPITPDRTY